MPNGRAALPYRDPEEDQRRCYLSRGKFDDRENAAPFERREPFGESCAAGGGGCLI